MTLSLKVPQGLWGLAGLEAPCRPYSTSKPNMPGLAPSSPSAAVVRVTNIVRYFMYSTLVCYYSTLYHTRLYYD